DDQWHAGGGRFNDGVGGGHRGHEDERAVGALGPDGLLDRVPDGESLVGRAALARRHSADDGGAVLLAARRVKGAFLAGDPLHHHARVPVDENGHYRIRETGSSRGWAVRAAPRLRLTWAGSSRGWAVRGAPRLRLTSSLIC